MKRQLMIFAIGILVLTHDVSVSASTACGDKCGTPHGTGSCQSDGKCLCWYGWTGPSASFVKSGSNKGKVKADHCQWACHWTHDYQNADCVDDDNGNCSGSDSGSESDSDDI